VILRFDCHADICLEHLCKRLKLLVVLVVSCTLLDVQHRVVAVLWKFDFFCVKKPCAVEIIDYGASVGEAHLLGSACHACKGAAERVVVVRKGNVAGAREGGCEVIVEVGGFVVLMSFRRRDSRG